MMWTYCFLAFIVFLILLIIYLFRYKRKKNISKPLRIIVWGTGILTLALLAISCFLPQDTQSNEINQKEQTEFFRISNAMANLTIFFLTLIRCFHLPKIWILPDKTIALFFFVCITKKPVIQRKKNSCLRKQKKTHP